jgi:ArsR family transcriptional regulator, arsenate/arsenite/antimonite-responsive transcriptional repressor
MCDFSVEFRLDMSVEFYYSIGMKLLKYSKMFKALSSEKRLKIFLMIYDHCLSSSRKTAGNVLSFDTPSVDKAFTRACKCVRVSRSTVSHHFKALKSAGLIKSTKVGRNHCYTINIQAVKELKKLFD